MVDAAVSWPCATSVLTTIARDASDELAKVWGPVMARHHHDPIATVRLCSARDVLHSTAAVAAARLGPHGAVTVLASSHPVPDEVQRVIYADWGRHVDVAVALARRLDLVADVADALAKRQHRRIKASLVNNPMLDVRAAWRVSGLLGAVGGWQATKRDRVVVDAFTAACDNDNENLVGPAIALLGAGNVSDSVQAGLRAVAARGWWRAPEAGWWVRRGAAGATLRLCLDLGAVAGWDEQAWATFVTVAATKTPGQLAPGQLGAGCWRDASTLADAASHASAAVRAAAWQHPDLAIQAAAVVTAGELGDELAAAAANPQLSLGAARVAIARLGDEAWRVMTCAHLDNATRRALLTGPAGATVASKLALGAAQHRRPDWWLPWATPALLRVAIARTEGSRTGAILADELVRRWPSLAYDFVDAASLSWVVPSSAVGGMVVRLGRLGAADATVLAALLGEHDAPVGTLVRAAGNVTASER